MVEDLLAGDFTFTSPDDIGIDKATYFERFWPNSKSMKAITVEKIFEERRRGLRPLRSGGR
jgi:hypothetical protein